MLRTPLLLALLALSTVCATAEEEDAGRTPVVVAAEVVRAHAAGTILVHLAREEPPDPWLVAEHLCANGAYEAAIAYAQAAPRPDIAGLPTYIDLQRKHPTPKDRRAALAEAERMFAAGRHEEADGRVLPLIDYNALTEGRAEGRKTVTTVLLLRVLGRSQLARDLVGGSIQLVRAANVAEDLGWHYAARRLTIEATEGVHRLRDEQSETILWRTALSHVAQMSIALGAFEVATPLLRRQYAESSKQGNWLFAYDAGIGLGRCLAPMGHLAEAEAAVEGALAAARSLGFDVMIGTALAELGRLASRRGDARRAIEFRERAAEALARVGLKTHEQQMFSLNGSAWRGLAEYPRAFEAFETSLALAEEAERPDRTAQVLSQIGATYRMLGSTRKAREHLERALGIVGKLGRPNLVAGILLNVAPLRAADGERDGVLPAQERALELYTLAENPVGIATAHAALGLTYANRKMAPKALDHRARALRTAEENGLADLRASILRGNGEIHASLDRREEGLALVREAAAEAERLQIPDLALRSRASEAGILYAAGRHEEALRAAHEGMAWVPRVMAGLAEEESAGVRSVNATIFEVGALAAYALGREKDLVFFLEGGRAGALLESLGGRDLLRQATVPPKLAREEAEARAREARALELYRDAVQSARVTRLREARSALAGARRAVEQVVERIQRETKAAAGLVYPLPASAEELKASLAPNEALVLYATLPKSLLATLVTKERIRAIDLGDPVPVEELCAALDPSGGADRFNDTIESLRGLVVAPLELPATIKTLMVSPSGALSYVPFGALAPARDIVYVPSGTAYALLTSQAGPRGTGILALGDPTYQGTSLMPLPETRVEAEALGTTVLLGPDATAANLFATIGSRECWRSIHLACHGLVDTRQPMRSALALTPTENHDGRVRVLDVMRHRLDADLAVLSACETGRGQIVRAEGIVGLTRAFMVAGAPRVLCSLWKVDDAATRALMMHFYERWSPKDGKGTTAARALREAQAHVRDERKWKHPHFWAAWVLWGLP